MKNKKNMNSTITSSAREIQAPSLHSYGNLQSIARKEKLNGFKSSLFESLSWLVNIKCLLLKSLISLL